MEDSTRHQSDPPNPLTGYQEPSNYRVVTKAQGNANLPITPMAPVFQGLNNYLIASTDTGHMDISS